VSVDDPDVDLLTLLRERLGKRSPKDGCAPQGQCGCCTVLVDGSPRVACLTPARRVAGRVVTTFDGLPSGVRERFVEAFLAHGASQCGYCTPGIIVRLAGMAMRQGPLGSATVRRALSAHLCRCTGWQTMVEAACAASSELGAAADPLCAASALQASSAEGVREPATASSPSSAARGPQASSGQRSLEAASRRASLEAGTRQVVARHVVEGRGGFADDTAPRDALVVVGEPPFRSALLEARSRRVGRSTARRGAGRVRPPLAPPELPGRPAVLRLATSFVDPAYLELDASWCVPGGEPASPLANGGAFGGKLASPVVEAARRLADELGRPVRVRMDRDALARHGPKRPPIAASLAADGTGRVLLGRTPRSPSLATMVERIRGVLPGVEVEEVAIPGPPVAASLRAAGFAEAAVLAAGLRAYAEGRLGPGSPVRLVSPHGASAEVRCWPGERVEVRVAAGEPLDEVVLRSWCIGAVHQGLGWVMSEGLALDDDGEVLDTTIRSFGVLPAARMPEVVVQLEESSGPPVPVADTVFAAAAAAIWVALSLPERWPVERVASGA
jgi:xanthine dehydrogenase small subunit